MVVTSGSACPKSRFYVYRKIQNFTTTYFVILSKQKLLSLVACIKLIIINSDLNHLPRNYDEVSRAFNSHDDEKQVELEKALAEEILNLCKKSGKVTAFIGMHAQQRSIHAQGKIGKSNTKVGDMIIDHTEESNKYHLGSVV